MPKRERALEEAPPEPASKRAPVAEDDRTAQQLQDEGEGVDADGGEQDERVRKLLGKLARAVQKDKPAEKIAKLKAKLKEHGATRAAIRAALAGDEYAHERDLRAGEGGDAARGAGRTSSTSSALSPPTHSVPVDPHEGMVLAKNGKWYPKPVPKGGNTSLLLFYAYVRPPWTQKERAEAIDFTHGVLSEGGCTGRLRVAVEGFNGTLTGPPQGIRAFCQALREYSPSNFGGVDYKIVDGMADNKAFRGLKVWPVVELVNYGFEASQARLEFGGTHVKPDVWTEMASKPNTVMIDVRNANETAIGSFAPPSGGALLLDPRMRRSTEFPTWVQDHIGDLRGKTIMMFCTAGIRCERASALLGQMGLPQESIYQLDGGVHRYLDAYPSDGGIWKGKNYTFDKRFNHGAEKSDVVGKCASCKAPWERYQSQSKCGVCKMETLLCRDCQRAGKDKTDRLLCWLCDEAEQMRRSGKAKEAAAALAAARAFAAGGGGRDGEGEGKGAAAMDDEEDGGGGGGGGGGSFGSRTKWSRSR